MDSYEVIVEELKNLKKYTEELEKENEKLRKIVEEKNCVVNDNIISEFQKVNSIYQDFDGKEDFSLWELRNAINEERK